MGKGRSAGATRRTCRVGAKGRIAPVAWRVNSSARAAEIGRACGTDFASVRGLVVRRGAERRPARRGAARGRRGEAAARTAVLPVAPDQRHQKSNGDQSQEGTLEDHGRSVSSRAVRGQRESGRGLRPASRARVADSLPTVRGRHTGYSNVGPPCEAVAEDLSKSRTFSVSYGRLCGSRQRRGFAKRGEALRLYRFRGARGTDGRVEVR